MAGLKPERKAVIVGGTIVLLAIFEALDIEVMEVSDWALREGVIYDMLGRDEQEDVRERTISSLLQRYHVDLEQAERVSLSSKTIFKQVKESWGLSKKGLKAVLNWGARLHEIGLDIAHSQYHKHGSYLLENSDLPGFSRQEQQQLAFLVLSHRRKIPIELLKECRKSECLLMSRLMVILRLSILLQRSHHQSDCDLDVAVEDDKIFVVRDSLLDVIDVRPVYFSDKKVVLKEVPDETMILTRPMMGAYSGMLVNVYQGIENKDEPNKAKN